MTSPFAFNLRRARPRAARLGRRAGLLRLAALAAVLALLAGLGWLWLRDSSFVRVTDVRVEGATSSDAERVRAALETAAASMTTLHVRKGALEAAVAPYSSVDTVRVATNFPHGMTITVVERRPVAALAMGGERVPVTGAGFVLRGIVADRDLPTIRPAKPITGKRVTDERVLGALTVARAAPAPLLHVAQQVSVEARGVVVELREGPELVFGSGEEAQAKWTAAARVLAEPSAAGAAYLDLRVPGRVAAGGLAPVSEPTPDPNAQPQGENGPTVNP
jgi:cell division protein FtsQ